MTKPSEKPKTVAPTRADGGARSELDPGARKGIFRAPGSAASAKPAKAKQRFSITSSRREVKRERCFLTGQTPVSFLCVIKHLMSLQHPRRNAHADNGVRRQNRSRRAFDWTEADYETVLFETEAFVPGISQLRSHYRHHIQGVENMLRHRNLRHLLAIVVLLTAVVIGSHSAAFAQATTAPLFAVLRGTNQISSSGQARAGDLNGYGSITVIIPNPTTLCFAVIVNGLESPLTTMHIHEGVAGVNGPVALTLTPIPTTGQAGTSSGCVTATSTLLNSIRSGPPRYYVNVHNVHFPGGAIRAQLSYNIDQSRP